VRASFDAKPMRLGIRNAQRLHNICTIFSRNMNLQSDGQDTTAFVKRELHSVFEAKWIALICCLFVTLIAVVQHATIQYHLKKNTSDELNLSARDIIQQISYQGTWDLKSYFNIYPSNGANYVIVTQPNSGGFVDVSGPFIPSLFSQAFLPQQWLVYDRLQTNATEAGTWLLYVHKLLDGILVLSIENPDFSQSQIQDINNAPRVFGDSIISALRTQPKQTGGEINYAIIGTNNDLKYIVGNLPLSVSPDYFGETGIKPIGPDYEILFVPIIAKASGKEGGILMVPTNVRLARKSLSDETAMIVLLALVSWAFFFAYGFYNWRRSETKIMALKKKFANFFSPQVLELISQNPESLQLGGQKREIAILFSDIRGFTTLSEELPAKTLTELLHEYFTLMTNEILITNGVVDKFIGDGIMAFWGAPLDQIDKEDRAVTAACRMVKRLSQLNERFPKISIGVGINTGVAVVGNMGSYERFEYTAVGDAVNVAARLEGLNKEFNSTIIISEQTKKNLTVQIRTEPLGEVKVKGRNEPVKIYKVLIDD
jgi:class 3 adenylate cyclase